MEILKTFFGILTPRERRNLYLLFCAVLVMAGLEVVSVGSIMPFLQVAADPESVHESVYLSWAFDTFGFKSASNFLIALGIGALAALVVSNTFIIFTTWALQKYIWGCNHSISRRLLESYLNRPYEYFLTRNSSELGKNILEEVKEITSKMLLPGLRGGAKAIVALAIVCFLLFVDLVISIAVVLILGVSYTLIYIIVRDRLDWSGEERVNANTNRYQNVNEAFGGIKALKLRGKEGAFLDKYSASSERYARMQAQYRIIRRAPRYILEAVAFGGIILIAIYLIAIQENIRQVIPMLGLYAFAGYRLMPALQQAFKGIASLRFNVAALEKIGDDIQDEEHSPLHISTNNSREADRGTLALKERLVLKNVCYSYPGSEENAIQNLSIEVPAKSTLGFVGKTGSGKTTTVDIILGLLRLQKGEIFIDGNNLWDNNVRGWQNNIGYVPQQIYLSDDTIAKNIAFGIPERDIDLDRIQDAAHRAHILRFVKENLPEKWNTVVGERGVKLSGGQRQRIGIARALYHQPSVLVFDEATSALDQATEANVMEAIYELEDDHTILMISHRLSTVKRADNIIMLEDGVKVDEGDYNYLVNKSHRFENLASA